MVKLCDLFGSNEFHAQFFGGEAEPIIPPDAAHGIDNM